MEYSNAAYMALVLVGASAGIASGLFGIGGGIIVVPALMYMLGYSVHRATGTSLAVLLPPVGLAAVLEYYRHDNVDIRAALIISAALFVGGWLGGYFANALPPYRLRYFFGIFLVIVGVYTISKASNEAGRRSVEEGTVEETIPEPIALEVQK